MSKKKKQNTEEVTVTFASPKDAENFEKALRIMKVPKVKASGRAIQLKYK